MKDQAIPLLGGLTAEAFLAEYWQKKPLLIRQAVQHLDPIIDFSVLKQLAVRDDVESRLVEYRADRWHLEKGPFRPSRFQRLPETDWTLLVQSVNHHLPHIADLLWRFDFIPYARLDDLMISYAPPGGTVGPHFDSYDVFLLQVGGKKRWQISAQSEAELGLVDDAPLKILKSFVADQTWELEEGDMLYLPPKYAHYGVALEPGMTYSIGFRAPSAQELANQFLVHLQDHLCLEGHYADPDLSWQANPAEISPAMVGQIAQMLAKIEWDHHTIGDFLGRYLTEPKAHVFYDPPEDPLDEDAFLACWQTGNALVLDLKTQLLSYQNSFYVNGEKLEVPNKDIVWWTDFAAKRRANYADLSIETVNLLYDAYLCGYWQFQN
ncbi:cupin domain-containing protein [Aquaspirillum serpens]|uniref:cupin domain-containing protein n=1 Tax=Aquaspirillum serpens TaxID=190 RepID=UPI0004286DD0|nr:cupin domain-containing protein [Aquaspirillum serpens]